MIIPASGDPTAFLACLRDDGTVDYYRTPIIAWRLDEETSDHGAQPVLAEGVDEETEVAIVEVGTHYTAWAIGTFPNLEQALTAAKAVLRFSKRDR